VSGTGFQSYRRLAGANRSIMAASLTKTDPAYENDPERHSEAMRASGA